MQSNIKWVVLLGISSLLLIGALITAMVKSDDRSEQEKKDVLRVKSERPALQPDIIRKHLEEAAEYVPPDPIEYAENLIEQHRERVESDPDSPDAPAYLAAMGNIYHLKLHDYEQAAYCYQQVLLRYPNYPQRLMIYPELATVYEKAGDHANTIRIYMEMLDVFPPDSASYKWAQEKLTLRHREPPTYEEYQHFKENDVVEMGGSVNQEEAPETSEESAAGEAEGELPQEEGETEGEPAPETATP